MNCRHAEGPVSDARRSVTSIPRVIASSSQLCHFPGICGAGATRAVTTGLPSTLPARQATINCRNGEGPSSDARRSFMSIPRFIASASQVFHVGFHDPPFVAATAGTATQAARAPAIASVVILMMILLLSELKVKGFIASLANMPPSAILYIDLRQRVVVCGRVDTQALDQR